MARHEKGEFGFIDSVKQMFSGLDQTMVEGIGDDCAVMDIDGEHVVVTTDMLIEDVHFLRRATTPFLLGRKSLSVNISDVAAMGARPFASLLSIALPQECRGEWADEFIRGYHSVSGEHRVMLAGGDTTASMGKIAINVVAFGRVAPQNIKRRSMARVGDRVLVAGVLGESSAGLKDILAGNYDTVLAQIHKDPSALVEEGVWLGAQSSVGAMMDLSDGLASDIGHILKLSGVSARIDIAKIPFTTTIEDAVCGGEDYKLLLTVDPQDCDRLCSDFVAQFGYPLSVVGEITRGIGAVEWYDNNTKITPNWHGFRHF